MAPRIEDLTPKQLVAVYNEYAPTPVSRFENRQKGQRRLLALLATANVKPAAAIAAVFPAYTAEAIAAAVLPAYTAEAISADGSRTMVAVTDEVEQQAHDAPLPDDPDWTPEDVGYGDKIEDDERLAREANAAAAKTGKAKRQRKTPAPTAPPSAPAPAVTGKARTLIVAACSRPEGATSAELFEATGWKYASWSHQLKLIAAQTGWTPEIRRYAGTARYFLREPAV